MNWLRKLDWRLVLAVLSALFGVDAAAGLVQGSALNSSTVGPSAALAAVGAAAAGVVAYRGRRPAAAVADPEDNGLAAVVYAAVTLTESPLVPADGKAAVAALVRDVLLEWGRRPAPDPVPDEVSPADPSASARGAQS